MGAHVLYIFYKVIDYYTQVAVVQTLIAEEITLCRDVARCAKVFVWFGHHFSRNDDRFDYEDFVNVRMCAQQGVKKAMILALAYCYHARLPNESRREYRNSLATAWRQMTRQRYQFGMGAGFRSVQVQEASWLDISEHSFNTILEDAQRSFAKYMNIGEGIAFDPEVLSFYIPYLFTMLKDWQ